MCEGSKTPPQTRHRKRGRAFPRKAGRLVSFQFLAATRRRKGGKETKSPIVQPPFALAKDCAQRRQRPYDISRPRRHSCTTGGKQKTYQRFFSTIFGQKSGKNPVDPQYPYNSSLIFVCKIAALRPLHKVSISKFVDWIIGTLHSPLCLHPSQHGVLGI